MTSSQSPRFLVKPIKQSKTPSDSIFTYIKQRKAVFDCKLASKLQRLPLNIHVDVPCVSHLYGSSPSLLGLIYPHIPLLTLCSPSFSPLAPPPPSAPPCPLFSCGDPQGNGACRLESVPSICGPSVWTGWVSLGLNSLINSTATYCRQHTFISQTFLL